MPKKLKPEHRIVNRIPSRNPERDWRFEHALASGVLAAPAALPATKDLREPWWSVGDQADTGACVGWATADGVLRWHLVGAGGLGKKERLSPRFLWMAAKETDAFTSEPTTFIESEGTSLKAALDIARKFGAVPDTALPAASGKLYGGETTALYALAARRKIASYFNLGRDQGQWRVWLATHGPILIGLQVDKTWDGAKALNPNLDKFDPASVRGGHAAVLVGYTATRFIVRNSWGTSWGAQGFAYASKAYAQANFSEAYGATL